MAKYRERLNLNEMSMSATLRADKKGTSYTVKKIGKKLQKHGGLKVGEKLSDTQADDLRDSGIKTKFKPYKEGMDPFADAISFNELEVRDWELDQHDGNLQELSPKTISSYQKKAGKQYREIRKSSPMSPNYAQGLADAGKMRQKDADSAIKQYDTMKKRGKGLAMSKGKGMKKEQVFEIKMPEDGTAYMVKNCGCQKDPCVEYGSIKEQIKKGAPIKPIKEAMMPGEGKATVKGGKLRMQRTMDKHGVQQQKPPIKGKIGKFKKVGESIQRRMDRKTIIATDPATGRKVVKIAPKKEIDIGKGKMESVVNEISDKLKMNYIKQAGKDVSYLEKQKMKPASKQVNNVRMDRDSAPFYKDVNKKNMDKEITKRRKGMRMAKGKLGNTVRQTVKQSGMKLGLSQGMKPSSKKLGEGAFKEMDTIRKEKQRIAKMKKPEYSKKEIRMGKGVAFDKRYKQGNYSGAYKTINKIKKGLADHPKVADALKRANEEFNKGE